MTATGINQNAKHPALLHILEPETLATLTKNGNARIYIEFDKYAAAEWKKMKISSLLLSAIT